MKEVYGKAFKPYIPYIAIGVVAAPQW